MDRGSEEWRVDNSVRWNGSRRRQRQGQSLEKGTLIDRAVSGVERDRKKGKGKKVDNRNWVGGCSQVQGQEEE
jgi:hypothetical protein